MNRYHLEKIIVNAARCNYVRVHIEHKLQALKFSTDLNVWGSYFYKQANDVARLKVPVTTGTESLEAFSIVFDPLLSFWMLCSSFLFTAARRS